MTTAMTESPENSSTDDQSPLEAARREKLARLVELGQDPWGGRFDDRTLVSDIRSRAGEIVYRTEEGQELSVPDPSSRGEEFNLRQWKADQGKGEMIGPQVRAAGRVVLHRDKGKLHFVDIRDWTGKIQLMVGQKQVGDDWAVVEQLDLGDIIGVDGMLGVATRASCRSLPSGFTFSPSRLKRRPTSMRGLQDAELRQRQRYLDLIHIRGVLPRFLEADEDRPLDSRDARQPRLCRSRGPDAAQHCRRGGGATVYHAPQCARHRSHAANRLGIAPQAADGRRH